MKSIIAKFICATVVALSAIAVDQHASAEQVIIEAQAHHLGDDPGNEGTVFEKTFVLNSVPPDAFLQLDITGPNLESPPQILSMAPLWDQSNHFFRLTTRTTHGGS